MKTQTKIWLIAATSLFLIGAILFGGAMSMLGWNFKKLSTVKYETNSFEITESFQNITVIGDTANVAFLPSEDGKVSVTCYTQKNTRHEVAVKDGTLEVKLDSVKKWYAYIGFDFDSPKIKIYLPAGAYAALSVKNETGDITIPKDFTFESMTLKASTGDVKNAASVAGDVQIKTSTGNICVENISAGALELSASTGKTTVSAVTCAGDVKLSVSTGKTILNNLHCANLHSNGSTGSLSMQNVIADGTFTIERDTGNVKFDRCDAAEISVKTDTGNIKGTLLSEKVFIYKTDTGSVSLPETVTGGKCTLKTDTGDIKIDIQK